MSEAVDDLELIPRSVRDKLDRIGVKVHLRDWQQFSRDERCRLRDLPCATPAQAERFRAILEAVVRQRTGRALELLNWEASGPSGKSRKDTESGS